MTASTVSLGQSPGLAADVNSLNNLKFQAGKDQKGALKEAAKQFEALFMRELLKSMREATMKSGLMENETGNLGADLLDQQYATQMTGMPGGLERHDRAPVVAANNAGRHAFFHTLQFSFRHAQRACQLQASGASPCRRRHGVAHAPEHG